MTEGFKHKRRGVSLPLYRMNGAKLDVDGAPLMNTSLCVYRQADYALL